MPNLHLKIAVNTKENFTIKHKTGPFNQMNGPVSHFYLEKFIKLRLILYQLFHKLLMLRLTFLLCVLL